MFCDNLQLPARRIGQRRGATRAPKQVDIQMGRVFLHSAFFYPAHLESPKALNPGGLGAAPQIK